jgi:hypothetical protein
MCYEGGWWTDILKFYGFELLVSAAGIYLFFVNQGFDFEYIGSFLRLYRTTAGSGCDVAGVTSLDCRDQGHYGHNPLVIDAMGVFVHSGDSLNVDFIFVMC